MALIRKYEQMSSLFTPDGVPTTNQRIELHPSRLRTDELIGVTYRRVDDSKTAIPLKIPPQHGPQLTNCQSLELSEELVGQGVSSLLQLALRWGGASLACKFQELPKTPKYKRKEGECGASMILSSDARKCFHSPIILKHDVRTYR